MARLCDAGQTSDRQSDANPATSVGIHQEQRTMTTTTLENNTPALAVSSLLPRVAGQPPRVDLYTPIHKALRLFMADTLVRVGSMDVRDTEEADGALEQLGGLLAMLRAHVSHENTFIHVAVEQRRPGAQHRLGDDHDDHLATIDELETQARALPNASDRDGAARRLYRLLALFVAENLEHMHVEETSNHTLLWELFSDAELIALHDRLLASIPASTMAANLRWFAGALNFEELAGMLGAMKSTMPPEAFAGVLDQVRLRMSETRWGRLASHLGVQQVLGLVSFA